jgi:hypothetical protein
MKRTADFWLLAAILTIGGMMALTSCSERNNPVVSPDEPQVENLADVTVMIYGSGGGSLDPNLITKLRRIYDADPASFERVKVAVQYKFSQPKKIKGWPDEETKNEFYATLEREGEEYVERNAGGKNYYRWMGAKGNATLRYVVDPEQTLYRQSKTSWLPDDNMDITNPDSLASFIRWAAQQCPARKYVLLMTDHGRGFLPHEEADPNEIIITRSMVEDMGHDRRHFTAKTLHQGVQRSGIPITTLYLDLCLMNTLEYLFEMKDLCDYIVASTYSTLGISFFDDLVDCLAKHPQDMATALTRTIELAMEQQEQSYESDILYLDYTVTRTDRLDHLGSVMREFTDRLCDTYENGTPEQQQAIDQVTAKAVKVSAMNPFYDVAKYMSAIMHALPEVYGDDFYEELKKAFNDCLVAQVYSEYLTSHDYQVDYSVLMGTQGHYMWGRWMQQIDRTYAISTIWSYEADGTLYEYNVKDPVFNDEDDTFTYTPELVAESTWAGTLASVYETTVFDKTVGWSRWIRMNRQEPTLWCKNDFEDELDDDDQ